MVAHFTNNGVMDPLLKGHGECRLLKLEACGFEDFEGAAGSWAAGIQTAGLAGVGGVWGLGGFGEFGGFWAVWGEWSGGVPSEALCIDVEVDHPLLGFWEGSIRGTPSGLLCLFIVLSQDRTKPSKGVVKD